MQKYFLSICILQIHFLNDLFERADIFHFDVVQFIMFSFSSYCFVLSKKNLNSKVALYFSVFCLKSFILLAFIFMHIHGQYQINVCVCRQVEDWGSLLSLFFKFNLYCSFSLPFSPLRLPYHNHRNHHTVVHVHESFFLFCSVHFLTP